MQKATQTHTPSLIRAERFRKTSRYQILSIQVLEGQKLADSIQSPFSNSMSQLRLRQLTKEKNKTMGISGTETVLQKGFLTELRNTSHLLLTKILILFNSKPTYGTGQVYKFVSEVFTMDHAS